MTEEQVSLVRDSFASVEGRAELLALLFYKRLFEVAPEMRTILRDDLETPARKFMQMLQTSVLLADRPDLLSVTLRSMARQQALFGVSEEDYGRITQAFLWALSEALGSELSSRALAAWTVFSQWVANIMQRGTALTDMRRQTAIV